MYRRFFSANFSLLKNQLRLFRLLCNEYLKILKLFEGKPIRLNHVIFSVLIKCLDSKKALLIFLKENSILNYLVDLFT